MSWSKTPTRPSDDSRRSVCTGARRRTAFHLDSAPASRSTNSKRTAADRSRITGKLRALTPGTVGGRRFDRLPAGGRILVPNRAAGVVKDSSVLPSQRRVEKPCAESHLAPCGGVYITSKVRCWLECDFTTGWSRRLICRTVSHL